jgi:hypothetical protein
MLEHRRFRRLEVRNLISSGVLKGGGEQLPLSVINVSPSGIGFEGPLEIREKSIVDICVTLNGCRICFQGQVRWLRKSELEDNKRGGIEITRISDEGKAVLLVYYTNQLLNMFPDPEIPW